MTPASARQQRSSGRALAAPDSGAHIKPPQQERSRQSLERALDAAAALLAERGSDTFTLAEVAERAEVSIGSIYGRVKSKDDLLRSVHTRELGRIEQESDAAFARLDADQPDLQHAVSFAIRAAASVLRRNAGVLGPFMLLANTDPVIADAGKRSHELLVHRYVEALAAYSAEIDHPDPIAAIHWTFTVVFSVLARYLALGSSRESAGQGGWDQMLTNLSAMTVSFLINPPAKSG